MVKKILRCFIKFLCRRSVGFFSQAFLVFLTCMKESKKRRRKQMGKLMAKFRSQPVNLPSARPLNNEPPEYCPISFIHQIGGVTIHCKRDH